MEAKEMMINDWLMHNDGTPMQVSVIKKDCFACSTQPHLYDYNNEFSPITLTSEILEANRFHRDCANIWEYVGNQYEPLIRFDVEYYCVVIDYDGQYIDSNIRHVHELQHALRLCGLDDLADNFKVE